jgi:hypothetical protein
LIKLKYKVYLCNPEKRGDELSKKRPEKKLQINNQKSLVERKRSVSLHPPFEGRAKERNEEGVKSFGNIKRKLIETASQN